MMFCGMTSPVGPSAPGGTWPLRSVGQDDTVDEDEEVDHFRVIDTRIRRKQDRVHVEPAYRCGLGNRENGVVKIVVVHPHETGIGGKIEFEIDLHP